MRVGWGKRSSVITLGDQARTAQQWSVAANYYSIALRRHPNNPPIWIQHGHMLKEDGQLAEAEKSYRAALTYDRGNPDASLHLGHVLKLQGRFGDAKTAYLRAFALDTSVADALTGLRELGWSDAQIAELKRFVEPEDATSGARETAGAIRPNTERVAHCDPAVELVRSPEIRRFGHVVAPLIAPSQWFDPRGLDIHFVIPDYGPGGGGHMNIFRICNYLESRGHRITLWIRDPGQSRTIEAAKDMLHRHFQHLAADIRFAGESISGEGDIIVATDVWTVPIVMRSRRFKRRFYFVQDLETTFFAEGTRRLLAESTYRMDLDCICGGPWLERLMAERYGRWARKFWQAADRIMYRPAATKSPTAIPHIAFYARMFSDRRAVDLGLLALEILGRRQVAFHVDFFGQDDLPFKATPFPSINHGVCDGWALARIYQQATIGLVFSATNYSIVPCEMMACELPLIDLDLENTRAVYPEGVVRLARPEPMAIAAAIESLLLDENARNRQTAAAADWSSRFSWSASGALVENAFLERLGDLDFQPKLPAIRETREYFATVVIPTYNGGALLQQVVAAVLAQRVPGDLQLICIDSSSTDGSNERLRAKTGIELITISQREFQHGRTRNEAVGHAGAEFVAFLTQDALPADDAWLYNLVAVLRSYPKAGGVFGRHIAHDNASAFVNRDLHAHFAQFDEMPVCIEPAGGWFAARREDPKARQAAHFYSDNNSCLRKSIWREVPLPEVDYGEDQLFAARLLEAGYAKAYARNAVVRHSHEDDPPTVTEERAYAEAKFFYNHFGYRILDAGRDPQHEIDEMNRHDAAWAAERGLPTEQIDLRFAWNRARIMGFARAMREVDPGKCR